MDRVRAVGLDCSFRSVMTQHRRSPSDILEFLSAKNSNYDNPEVDMLTGKQVQWFDATPAGLHGMGALHA